jgi:integrase
MPDRRKRSRIWSYSAGEYGATVRVFERRPGGNLYVEASGVDAFSLGHKDRDRAKDYADAEATKLRQGLETLAGGPPTLGRVLDLYLAERTPEKAARTRSEDRRQAEMLKRAWGKGFDLRRLSRREWDALLRARRTGSIDARGHRVPPDAEKPEGEPRTGVSDRTVERDLRFVRAVCRWATEWRDDDGRLLLERDPTRGLSIPREANPSRPVATHDRVDALRPHLAAPRMEVIWGKKRRKVETYLPEIFEIVVGTGRRISAVCGLRQEDLELERTPKTPHGAITWPEDTDKMDRRWRCPISAPVRAALEAALRKRPRVGPGPLFPAPRSAEKPVRYELASEWLQEAEEAAKLTPQQGTLWHAYRRLWASARKDLPDVDVAQAGGWASLEALKLAYQRPDDATMLRVVEHDAELREVR